MAKDKSIFIKNIYYMLTYAFQVLKQSNYEEIAAEQFDMVEDLFAAILAKGVARQLKQGLYREYVTIQDTLSVIRGKLDMPGTIRNRIQRSQKVDCVFDELSENNPMNQVLKTTMAFLLQAENVSMEHKQTLKKEMVFFDGVEEIAPSAIRWNRLQYQRNNQNYELLMNICYFVLEGMLQTTDQGDYRMAAFSDEHMARLYEKFILEYYTEHHTYLSEVKAAQVKWDLVGEQDEALIKFLPTMQTDITLRMGEKTLIIDAKYYGETLQKQYDTYKLHSGNVYQIFTYVKNMDRDHNGNVGGLLLYAKTDEMITPDLVVNMGGNWIGAKTLDLNTDFRMISTQLDQIAVDFFEGNVSAEADDENEIRRVERRTGDRLIQVSRKTYRTEQGDKGFVFRESKPYSQGKKEQYWFAFRNEPYDRIAGCAEQYMVLVCGGKDSIVLLPREFINDHLKEMRYSPDPQGNPKHWHIYIYRDEFDHLTMQIDGTQETEVSMDEYRV